MCWIIPAVTFFATWFFMVPAFRCSLTVSRAEYGEFEIWYGYWNLESAVLAQEHGPESDRNVCIDWNKESIENLFDGVWRFGRCVGVIGSFTCLLTAFFNFFLIWRRFSLRWFTIMIVMHIVNTTLCLLLLVGLASTICANTNCVLGRAGYVAIVGAVFWLIATILYYCMREKELELQMDQPDEFPPKPYEDYEEAPRYEDEEEPRLALPPSESASKRSIPRRSEKPLALPPSESAQAGREKPLALPLSENYVVEDAPPKSPRPSKSRSNSGKKLQSTSNKERPSLEKRGSSKKGPTKKKSTNDGTAEPPSSPRKSGTVEPPSNKERPSLEKRGSSKKGPTKKKKSTYDGTAEPPSSPGKSGTAEPPSNKERPSLEKRGSSKKGRTKKKKSTNDGTAQPPSSPGKSGTAEPPSTSNKERPSLEKRGSSRKGPTRKKKSKNDGNAQPPPSLPKGGTAEPPSNKERPSLEKRGSSKKRPTKKKSTNPFYC
jgi:hypothetical protein